LISSDEGERREVESVRSEDVKGLVHISETSDSP
jgi:hypothetical protein